MATFFLNLVAYDPANPIPADGSFNAAIRPEEGLFYCSSVDVPANALIEVLHVTKYIFVELPNIAAINIIKAGDNGIGDGKIYNVIIDESITDQGTAIARAQAADAALCKVNYQLSFSTYVKGWKAGQQFTFRHDARNISATMVIQEVKKKYLTGNRILSSITASTVTILKPQQVMDKLLNSTQNPQKPRLVSF